VGIELAEEPGRLAYEKLTLVSRRSGEVLVGGLDAAVPAKARVLVTGAEDARFALFRATAGLWEGGRGRIVRPPRERIRFLPERPYLPPGTLREALLATGSGGLADAELAAVLRALRLDAVVARAGGLDVERDWDDLLSLAEQQLFSVARVRLASPTHAVLQSPGTTLRPDALGTALRVLSEASITCLVFGSEADSLAYDAVLELAPGGAWTFSPPQREGSA
jgi:putative ATP-binding cassette transporter